MIGDPMVIKCPLEEEDIMKGVEGHWIEGMVMTEVFLEEEDPLIETVDPLMVEDPQEMEDDQDILEDHQDLLDQCNLVLCKSPK